MECLLADRFSGRRCDALVPGNGGLFSRVLAGVIGKMRRGPLENGRLRVVDLSGLHSPVLSFIERQPGPDAVPLGPVLGSGVLIDTLSG